MVEVPIRNGPKSAGPPRGKSKKGVRQVPLYGESGCSPWWNPDLGEEEESGTRWVKMTEKKDHWAWIH